MVSKESKATIAALAAFAMKLCKCIDFAAKNASDSNSDLACLGYLGWCDTNRTNPICVASPMVAKESKAAIAAAAAFAMILWK